MTLKDELIRVLYQQVDIIQQLVETMFEKQRAVVTMQYDTLRTHVSAEEGLTLKLRRLEERRMKLLMDMTGKTAKEIGEYSITEMIAASNQQEAGVLRSLQKQYKSLLKKLNSVNDTNRVLIEHSRRFVQSTLRIITANHERKLVDHRM